jgi:MFS family permease
MSSKQFIHALKVSSNLRWVLLDTAISTLGAQFTAIALPWLALKHAGTTQLAAVIVVIGIPHLLLILVGGAITDRSSPRTVLIWTNYASATLLTLLGLYVLGGTLTTAILIGFALCIGICSAFAIPATASLLPRAVPSDLLVPANALLMAVRQLATLAGPLAAGALIAFMTSRTESSSEGGIATALLIDAAAFLIAAVIVRFIVLHAVPSAELTATPASIVRAVGSGFAQLWRDVPLRSFVIYYGIMVLLLSGPVQVGFPVLADTRLAYGAGSLGLLIASYSAGTLFGMTAAGAWPQARIATLGVTIVGIDLIAGLAFAAFGYVSSTSLSILLCVLIGVGGGYVQVALISWIQRRIPLEMMGRTMSVFMFVTVSMSSASAALSGVYLKNFPLATLFVLCGSAVSVVALCATLSRVIRSIDSVTASPSTTSTPAAESH